MVPRKQTKGDENDESRLEARVMIYHDLNMTVQTGMILESKYMTDCADRRIKRAERCDNASCRAKLFNNISYVTNTFATNCMSEFEISPEKIPYNANGNDGKPKRLNANYDQ